MESVARYFERIERAMLDIEEDKRPVDGTIILWWGLDGIQLNEDGTAETVSRRKKASESVPHSGMGTSIYFADNAPYCSIVQPTMLPAAAALMACCASPIQNFAQTSLYASVCSQRLCAHMPYYDTASSLCNYCSPF